MYSEGIGIVIKLFSKDDINGNWGPITRLSNARDFIDVSWGITFLEWMNSVL